MADTEWQFWCFVVKVLIVDDSQTVRELLKALLECDDEIKVVATAASGEQALEILPRVKPDIITMDLHMPKMSGLDVTRKIMAEKPLPIIIVTADKDSALQPFKLLEAGAVAVLETPPAPGQPGYALAAEKLIKTVKSLSGVKLITRHNHGADEKSPKLIPHVRPSSQQRVVLIGASTGGPQALKKIVDGLTPNYPFPIVVTQHIAMGFLNGFAMWLNESKTVVAKIAEENELVRPGHLYLAADDVHTGLRVDGTIFFSNAEKEYGLRPSVSYLFRSAQSYAPKVLAVLLTGMGRDGSAEIGLIKTGGGITIAQDKETSIVFGMPGEAVRLGNAQYVLALPLITKMLNDVAGGYLRKYNELNSGNKQMIEK